MNSAKIFLFLVYFSSVLVAGELEKDSNQFIFNPTNDLIFNIVSNVNQELSEGQRVLIKFKDNEIRVILKKMDPERFPLTIQVDKKTAKNSYFIEFLQNVAHVKTLIIPSEEDFFKLAWLISNNYQGKDFCFYTNDFISWESMKKLLSNPQLNRLELRGNFRFCSSALKFLQGNFDLRYCNSKERKCLVLEKPTEDKKEYMRSFHFCSDNESPSFNSLIHRAFEHSWDVGEIEIIGQYKLPPKLYTSIFQCMKATYKVDDRVPYELIFRRAETSKNNTFVINLNDEQLIIDEKLKIVELLSCVKKIEITYPKIGKKNIEAIFLENISTIENFFIARHEGASVVFDTDESYFAINILDYLERPFDEGIKELQFKGINQISCSSLKSFLQNYQGITQITLPLRFQTHQKELEEIRSDLVVKFSDE